MFNDSTVLLGIMSTLVCLFIIAYFFFMRKSLSYFETIGLSLVLAGGLGNAIDRFSLGYVVDFIEFSFIDFPVFNIADIGVTCGFALFLLGFILRERKLSKQLKQNADIEEAEPLPISNKQVNKDEPEVSAKERK